MTVDLCNQQSALPFPEEYAALIRKTVETALSFFDVAHPSVTIAIVDDERIHELNLRYRGIDRPTDVLSFAAREGMQLAQPGKGEYLGDIAISLPTARRQGEEYGHGIRRELAFLTAHGMLHLLGYDHMTPEDEREMFALQEEIMTKMGLPRGQAVQIGSTAPDNNGEGENRQ